MVYVAKDDQDVGTIHDGTRVCRRCGERKPMQKFYLANGGRHRRRKCSACVETERQEYWAKNPDAKVRNARTATNSHLRLSYGITVEERDRLFAEQNGRCAICSAVLSMGDGVLTSKAHVDHDHETGRVRGLLCFTCNTALGKFGDNVELLENAIAYLRRNEWSHYEKFLRNLRGIMRRGT